MDCSLMAVANIVCLPVQVAKALMDVFAEMIFVHGFVHGDPHPGNVLVSPVDHGGFSLGMTVS